MEIDFEVLRPKFEKIFKFSRTYDDYLSSGKTDDWIFLYYDLDAGYKRESVNEAWEFYKKSIISYLE